MEKSENLKEFKIKSEISEIKTIEKIVEELLIDFNVDNNLFGDIVVSVVEAFTNAVVHGNKSDPDKIILIEAKDEKDKFFISIKDEGLGFDFNNIPDPTLPQNIEKFNGRGIFLMKNLSSGLEFFENGTKVQLKFSKKL
jgi:serine/threonine-protein kinase RsbW